MYPKRYAGIGSREAPDYMLDLMTQLGRELCTDGWQLASGFAKGSDKAFYKGATLSPRFREVGALNILAGNERDLPFVDPDNGFINAQTLPNYEQARQLALEARGSWHGLEVNGIALHSRNPYQVLGLDLQSPVQAVVLYAEPIGTGRAVKGGTNTAYQIALKHGIPVYNLYTPEGMEYAENYLRKALNSRI